MKFAEFKGKWFVHEEGKGWINDKGSIHVVPAHASFYKDLTMATANGFKATPDQGKSISALSPVETPKK